MLCVIARIDEKSRQRLKVLQKEAEKQGVLLRHLHGHVTLAVYTGEETESFIASCKTILSRFKRFTIHYERLAILREPSTIVVCPTKTGILDEMQRQIAEVWSAQLNIWTQREIWLPHTTLVQDQTADLDAVLTAMERMFEPFDACVTTIEFSSVRPEGYEIVDCVVV